MENELPENHGTIGIVAGPSVVLVLVTSYLLLCSLSRVVHWTRIIRSRNPSLSHQLNVAEAPRLNLGKSNSTQAHVIFYTITTCLLTVVLVRSLLYVILVIMGPSSSQLACDLILETATLLSGLGLVFVYTFVWRCQRYLYFLKEFHQFYTTGVRVFSWSVSFVMTITCMTRLMLYMMSWRFGAQTYPGKFSCHMYPYPTDGRISYLEWNLMYVYNCVVGAVVTLLACSLYLNLWIRCKGTFGGSGVAVSCTISSQLSRSTICSVVILASAVIADVLLWFVVPESSPAILIYMVEDAGFVVQVVAMFLSLGDWNTVFTPQSLVREFCCTRCRRSGNSAQSDSNPAPSDEASRTYVLEELPPSS